MVDKYDAILSKILEEGLTEYFDIIYSFLYRKTDYFIVTRETKAKLGFPPGGAINISKNAFNKYMEMSNTASLKRAVASGESIMVPRGVETLNKNKVASLPAKDKVASLPIKDKVAALPAKDKVASLPAKDKVNKSKSAATPRKLHPEEEIRQQGGKPITNFSPEPTNEKGANDSDDEKLTPEAQKLKDEQIVYQGESESYNGADRLAYKWSQSIEDIDILVKVPESIVRGNQVKVKVDKQQLKVEYLHEGHGEWITAVDNALSWTVRNTDSVWSLIPGKHVSVSIDKVGERWWESAFSDEDKINVSNIDASRPMSDLDHESQSKIHELMYNQHRKQAGLPTTDQMKKEDLLKKAWNVEGSPFKGSDFDPSVLRDSNI